MPTSQKKIEASRRNIKFAILKNSERKGVFICKQCKTQSVIALCLVNRKKYCSWGCRKLAMRGINGPNTNGGQWMKGENNPNWKGGKSKKEPLRDIKEMAAWRRQIFARDNYTCQKCNKYPKTKNQLNAHHLIPWSINYYTRNLINNGITLCVGCHKKVHKMGWDKFVNPEFLEWMMGYPSGWTEVKPSETP